MSRLRTLRLLQLHRRLDIVHPSLECKKRAPKDVCLNSIWSESLHSPSVHSTDPDALLTRLRTPQKRDLAATAQAKPDEYENAEHDDI